MHLFLSRLTSPLGEMLLVTDSYQNIGALDFANYESRLHQGLRMRFGNHLLEPIEPPTLIAAAL
ncbi:hypothetical protein [Pseudomonas kurunegalensis]|uniref:hypothetical protein n=1 Tax=Pseudomonas kurunegalensis TaxID=485880 RepID=UPI0025708BFE|nr:hypothetical protein [Pseudomonas kurunegalensis]WJD60031.1 hypothetical protein QQ992_13850 [Pseudomonas kurunegalensis]